MENTYYCGFCGQPLTEKVEGDWGYSQKDGHKIYMLVCKNFQAAQDLAWSTSYVAQGDGYKYREFKNPNNHNYRYSIRD